MPLLKVCKTYNFNTKRVEASISQEEMAKKCSKQFKGSVTAVWLMMESFYFKEATLLQGMAPMGELERQMQASFDAMKED